MRLEDYPFAFAYPQDSLYRHGLRRPNIQNLVGSQTAEEKLEILGRAVI